MRKSKASRSMAERRTRGTGSIRFSARSSQVSERIVLATTGLTCVSAGAGWLAIAVPILVAAPAYLHSAMTFGELMVIVGAFNQVQQALRWFVDNFSTIADWRATLASRGEFPEDAPHDGQAWRERKPDRVGRMGARLDRESTTFRSPRPRAASCSAKVMWSSGLANAPSSSATRLRSACCFERSPDFGPGAAAELTARPATRSSSCRRRATLRRGRCAPRSPIRTRPSPTTKRESQGVGRRSASNISSRCSMRRNDGTAG